MDCFVASLLAMTSQLELPENIRLTDVNASSIIEL